MSSYHHDRINLIIGRYHNLSNITPRHSIIAASRSRHQLNGKQQPYAANATIARNNNDNRVTQHNMYSSHSSAIASYRHRNIALAAAA